jgi:hypothetical protein
MAETPLLQPILKVLADSNHRQFTDGARILAAIEGLVRRIDSLEQTVNGMREDLIAECVYHDPCICCRSRLHTRRLNGEARIQNAKIGADAEVRLAPLVSYQTLEFIPNFPLTPQAIGSLQGMRDRHAFFAAFSFPLSGTCRN